MYETSQINATIWSAMATMRRRRSGGDDQDDQTSGPLSQATSIDAGLRPPSSAMADDDGRRSGRPESIGVVVGMATVGCGRPDAEGRRRLTPVRSMRRSNRLGASSISWWRFRVVGLGWRSVERRPSRRKRRAQRRRTARCPGWPLVHRWPRMTIDLGLPATARPARDPVASRSVFIACSRGSWFVSYLTHMSHAGGKTSSGTGQKAARIPEISGRPQVATFGPCRVRRDLGIGGPPAGRAPRRGPWATRRPTSPPSG